MAGGKQWKEKVSNAAYASQCVYLANTNEVKTSMENITMENLWWTAQSDTHFERITSHNTIITENIVDLSYENKIPRTAVPSCTTSGTRTTGWKTRVYMVYRV